MNKGLRTSLQSSILCYVQRVTIACIFLLFASAVVAGDYYSKVSVSTTKTSSGRGKVYVTGKTLLTSYVEPEDNDYKESLDCTVPSSTFVTHTYKLYAKSELGYYFVGWCNEEELEPNNSDNPRELNGPSPQQGENVPTEDYFAKFEPVSVVEKNIVNDITITNLFTEGTGSVIFQVANADEKEDFLVASSLKEFSVDITNIAGNLVTVTVNYTDKNHHGDKVASADITLTSRGDANSKATATINVNTDLTPRFTKPVDYNFGTIYAGDAKGSQTALYATGLNGSASQASPASAGVTGAKWTATITGDGATAFFLTSANPEKGQAVVTFRPAAAGTYNATLNLKVDYTDAHGNTKSSATTTTALTGVAETPIESAIVFDPTSWDFGNQVTGSEGSKEISVSQQNVSNVTYSFGDTNAEGVFSLTEEVGSIFVYATPTAPGTYNAKITATGTDTRDPLPTGATGTTTSSLSLSITVGLASPVLTGGSNLKDTYYLKWTKIPYANTYEVYEVNGGGKTLVTASAEAEDVHSITRSINPASATKTYIIKAIGEYNDVAYTSWSNPVTVELNVLTDVGVPYLKLYTGTDLDAFKFKNIPWIDPNTGEQGIDAEGNLVWASTEFFGEVIPKKPINLINTFDANGKALFDELYVFGETYSSDGNEFRPASPTATNNIITPCYVFTKRDDSYVWSNTIDNVNQATKQLPNPTSRCWTIDAGKNKKLYFTGFCPFGSNGNTKEDEGIIYIKGAAGATVDVYLEDCQLYSRAHTTYGDLKGKDDVSMDVFTIDANVVQLGAAFAGGGGKVDMDAPSAGSASAIVFECTTNANTSNPFRPSIHTIGNNILFSQLGCSGYFSAVGKELRIGQYSASLQVRVTEETKRSYTTLSFDDKWPTDATNYELHKRTNGYLRFQKVSENSPSIEMGNQNTIVNFNGGRIELSNSVPGAQYYLNTLAICYRSGYALYQGIDLFVGYGLGQDEVGGEVNFNDGTVNALVSYPKQDYWGYLEVDEATGQSTALRCPANTFITGGSHNSQVLACSAVDKLGGSPKDKAGNPLVKLDYQLPGEANIQVDPNTNLVIPESMPNRLTCVGCGEGGTDTELDLEFYGKQSLSPDASKYIHLWAPGAGRVEYNITSWVLSMPRVTAGYDAGIGEVETVIGGEKKVPSGELDKVNNLLYVQIDQNMQAVLDNDNYDIPVLLGTEYITANVVGSDGTLYCDITNTSPYTIHNKIYYIRVIEADEWIMFSPPFDVSNVYVIETSSEAELETLAKEENGRAKALAMQAEYNMDFSAIVADAINKDSKSNLGRTFETHYTDYVNYTMHPTNKKKGDYSGGVLKQRIYPFTGDNYWANFFLYKSEDAEWKYYGENGSFVTDWQIAQPINKMIGDVEREVIMEQGGIYALQFPFCPKCENEGEERTKWDYWTGKFIIFEGYGPQIIAGKDIHGTIDAHIYEEPNSGQLLGNPVFAEYEATHSNAYFCDSYNDLQHDQEGENIMNAGAVFMLANITSPSGMPAKRVDFQSGAITWEEGGDNQNTTTGTPTISGDRQMMVYTIEGGVGIIPVTAQQVSIYNAAGQLITSQYLTEEVQISLPAGIYLISGEKEQAKAIVR